MPAHPQSARPFPRTRRAAGFPAGGLRRPLRRRSIWTSCWPTSRRSSSACCPTICSPSCSTTSSGRTCASATAWGIAKRWCRRCPCGWAKASPAWPPPRREPVLVGDVRNDPRYLNTLDAVRTELAVPMIARGKLVGVIDLQSTRVNAYTRVRPRAAAADRGARERRHRQRAAVPPRGAAEPHAAHAGRTSRASSPRSWT